MKTRSLAEAFYYAVWHVAFEMNEPGTWSARVSDREAEWLHIVATDGQVTTLVMPFCEAQLAALTEVRSRRSTRPLS